MYIATMHINNATTYYTKNNFCFCVDQPESPLPSLDVTDSLAEDNSNQSALKSMFI